MITSVHAETITYEAPVEQKEVQIEVHVEWTPERIEKEIDDRAKEYGVSASEMKRVMYCESSGSTTIQSHYRYTKNNVPKGYAVGDREESYGLFQIHLPAHTDVTKEQAIDPKFAIEWTAKHWKDTRWSCK